MPNFGTTPTSTTTLGTNQFPVSAAWVPNSGTQGNLTAVEGIAINTDSNGFQSTAIRLGLKDGDDATQGLTTDVAVTGDVAGTISAKLRGLNKIFAQLQFDGSNFLKINVSAGTVAATQSGTWNINNISGTVSLPTGAATAAKQPAIGTAGSSSTDVLTVQGIAGGTAVPVSGTFWQATQPISAASLPLPSGAATSAKQPALGTAGTASTDVLTVQGIASMTPLTVSGSGSFTVTQATGTNLHTVVDSGSITATTNADTTIGGTSAPSKGLLAIGKTNDATAQYQPLPEGAGGRSVIVEGYSGGTAVPVSGTFWQATQPVSGTVTVQQSTASNLKVDLSGTAANATAIKVDGSAVTQPVSGTITANIGTTNGLALDTSVNGILLAQASTTSGQKGPIVQAAVTTSAPSYTTAQTSPLSLTTAGALRVDNSAVTQPVSGTVTVQQSTASNLKVDLSGTAANSTAIKVDGSAVTQPVSGTVTANAGSGTFTVSDQHSNITTDYDTGAGTQTMTMYGLALPASGGSVAGGTSSNPVRIDPTGTTTQPVSGTVSITANSSVNVAQVAGTTTDTNSGNKSAGTIRVVLATDQPQLTNALKVDGSGVTQPVSGTITANIGTSGSLALDTSVNGILLAQASTTSGQKGPLIQAAVTTNAPTYTTAQTSPLSLDTGGLLRVSLKDTPSNSNNLNVALAASSATVTVSASGNFNNASVGSTGSAVPASASYVGGNKGGNLTGLSLDGSGNLNVNVAAGSSGNAAAAATGSAVPASADYTGINVAGTLRGQTGVNPSGTIYAGQVDLSSIAGTTADTNSGNKSAGTLRVVLATDQPALTNALSVAQNGTWTVQPGNTQNSTAWLTQDAADGPVSAGTAASKSILGGLVYNSSAPAPTSGQQVALQADQAGNMRVFSGVALATLSAWNNGTSLNATQTIFTNSGAESVLVQLTQTTTITGGAATFEVSYDGSNWSTIPANNVVDPTSATFAQISLPYTLQASTNKQFLLLTNGAQGLRIKLSTVISGTGAVTPNYALLPFSPLDQAVVFSPTAANFQVTANAGTNLNTSLLAVESGGNLATLAGAVTSAKMQANVAQINGVAPSMGNGVSGTGVQRVTIASDSTGQVTLAAGAAVTANIGTTNGLALDTSVNGLLVSQGSTTSGEKGPMVQAAVTTNAPSYTTAQTSPLSLDTSGLLRVSLKDTPANTNNLNVNLAASAATVTVSGTVTANIGTSGSLALDATVAKINVAQAAALGSNTGPMVQGSVTTNAPSYTTGNINPFSLDTSGLLRVSLKDTPSNTNNFNVALAASSATVTVTATNLQTNLNQIAGSAISTAASGTQKVGIVGNAGATLDSTIGAGTAPTNAIVTGAVYNSSAPAPTSGQSMALQVDQAGNVRTFPGIALTTLAAWNNGTSLNSTQTIFSNSGTAAVLVQLTQTSTITAGAVTFEVSYDNSNWSTIPASCVLDPTSTTFAQISLPYTLQANTNKAILLNMNGAQGLRIKLSTAITGTGAVTPNYALLPMSPADTVVALSPTAANFNVTANQGGSWTVTANAGTNLNTSALALDTSVNGILLSQGSTTSGQKGPLVLGAVTTNAPSYTTAQSSPISLDTSGLLRASLKDTPSNTNNLNINLAASAATVTVTAANLQTNLNQIAGSAISTAASGIQKVGIVGNGAATLDSTVGAGTAPTNAIAVSGLYNSSAPAPTSGQAMALQLDQAGNIREFPGIALATLSAWNSSTSLNATQNIFTNSGAAAVLVQLTQTTTLTAGAVTFEVSYDNSNWSTIPANCVLDPTSTTFAQISLPYTVQANTNKAILLNMNGAQALRIKLSTQITGTGTVTPNYALLPLSPADTVIALSPTAANFNVTAVQSGTWAQNITQISGSSVATAATGIMKVGVTDASGNSINSTSNALNVSVQNSTLAVTQSGTWTAVPNAATSGGSTPSHTISASGTNATSLKGSAGQVWGFCISNSNSSARFFKLYDKSSAPTVGTDTPKMTVQVPGSGTVIRAFPVGLTFSNGIGWALTTGIADSDTGSVGTDISVDIDYK